MRLDKRFIFSISLRALLLTAFVLLAGGSSTAILNWNHNQHLKVQKDEYRRRLRFLNQSTSAFSAATGIMESYWQGDTAFGLARQKAIMADENLHAAAKNSLESSLAAANSRLVRLYSECEKHFGDCTQELDAARLNYTKVSDALMDEANKYEWKPKACFEDDPYIEYKDK